MQGLYLRCGITSIVILMFCFQGCNKQFNEYYHPETTLGKSILGVLEEKGEYELFLSLIDKAELRKTLGESAIYTCLAPKDEYVRAYFIDHLKYASIEQVPLADIKTYINFHFIAGMYYAFDLEKRYTGLEGAINRSRVTNYKTRSEGKISGKSIRIITPSFLRDQGTDFEFLYGDQAEDGYYVEGVAISESERDIDARNGVIHVLAAPLFPTLRTDQAIAKDPELSIFSSWLERHAQFELGEIDDNGNLDTMLYKNYSFGRNLADEGTFSTLFAPTNQAIADYFKPYMHLIHNTLDSVPKHVMYSLIRSSVHSNMWYHSDLVRNDPAWSALTGFIKFGNPVLESIVGVTLASNSFIYKTNKVMESPEMSSVKSGIMLMYKTYGQWYWMMSNKGLGAGMVDALIYQHSPKTLLVQTDETWGSPFAQDMDAERLEQRLDACRAGIFHFDTHADGGFKKRYYPTDQGYILYSEQKFFDYTGHSVNLVAADPVWTRPTGAIYEIDGFLTPLDKLDAEITVWKRIQANPNLSTYKALVEKAQMVGELQLLGFFTYSIFAPSDAAFQAAGIKASEMSEAEAKTIVSRHIITNRFLFTDGVFSGQLASKSGEPVVFSGAWDGFTLKFGKSVAGTNAQASNQQGSNGVLHEINNVLLPN